MHSPTSPPLIGWVRPAHWRALDRIYAGLYVIPAFLSVVKHGGPFVPVLAVAASAPIALRRARPVVAYAIAGAGTVLGMVAEPRAVAVFLLPLAYVLYAVSAQCRPRTAFAALALSLAGALATALPDFRHRGAAGAFSLVLITVWTVGYAVGAHRRYTAKLLAQQARLAEAELERARRGVVEERLRIARELHDMVAHSMSVITVQAGFGGLVIDSSPDEARAALAVIEGSGRETLAEMRRLLGVLREAGAADLAPAPSLADLDRLVERTASAGVRVDLSVTGVVREVPVGVELSAYRIVQEALTNVVRHAGTGSARVTLDYGEGELAVEITDEGRGAAASSGGTGHGIVGMRERVHLYGGRFAAGPLPGGGFRVSAVLPLEPPPEDVLPPESPSQAVPPPDMRAQAVPPPDPRTRAVPLADMRAQAVPPPDPRTRVVPPLDSPSRAVAPPDTRSPAVAQRSEAAPPGDASVSSSDAW